jgi:hypothetical protein
MSCIYSKLPVEIIHNILNYEGTFICRNGIISKKIPKNDIRYIFFSKFEFNLGIGLSLRHNINPQNAKNNIILLRIKKHFSDYENELGACHNMCI